MKKVLLTAFVISASVCGFAQDQKSSPATETPVVKEASQKTDMAKQAKDWQELLVTELKLTEEQQKKIAEMDKAFGERRQAIHNNPDLTDEQKKERKMTLLKAREAQFAKLLTPEQQARYNELVAARGK